jgi:hypothetical protein
MTTFRDVLIHQLGCVAASALMSLLPTPSLAVDTCPQWALQGELVFVHSNGTVAKLSNLEQTGSQFNGAGHYYHANQANAGGLFGSAAIKHRDVDGRVVGTAVGNSFEATVYWGSSSIGVYTGQIGPQGLLVGRTYDKTDPTEAAGFQSDKPLVCLSREQSAPRHGATPAKPASATGPVQSDAPTPASTSVCDAAHSAEARNSPAAPGLERQCKALTEAVNFTPRVIEPVPGSVHRPQTAMAIRVAPGTTAQDSAYEVEIQVRANLDWRVSTHIPVSAPVAQSGLGYRGWGAHVAGTGAHMTAVVGAYRVRAWATAPRKSAPSEWVEFKIDAELGVTKEGLARRNLNANFGVGAALGAAAAPRVTDAPGAKVGAIAPPYKPGSGSVNPAAKVNVTSAVASPLQKKADAVSLNRQPLPPGGTPAVLPTQAPSALR